MDYCIQLRQTFNQRIDANEWMSDASKQLAKEKLNAMTFNIGSPDEWFSEGFADISNEKTLLDDIMALRRTNLALCRKIAGMETPRASFHSLMTTYDLTVMNAFYSPNFNAMNIYPAWMLPPLLDSQQNDAHNYATMMVFGHEITHGFDTYGAMRDANGRQNSIISGNDQSEFDKRSNDMIAYFGSFTYGDGIPVDGERTNRENIADQGGLHNAYDALMKRSGGQASERLYKAREYFRAYAYGWLEKGTEGYMDVYLTDVHSPGCIRATGNVFMADEFYEAFGITDGKQYITPKKRIHIW
jgi:putative endopeptidase